MWKLAFLVYCERKESLGHHPVSCVCAQSCPSLDDAMDCSPPGSSVYEISQSRILEWVAISSSRGSFWPTDQGIHVSSISCIAGGFFTSEPLGKPVSLHILPKFTYVRTALFRLVRLYTCLMYWLYNYSVSFMMCTEHWSLQLAWHDLLLQTLGMARSFQPWHLSWNITYSEKHSLTSSRDTPPPPLPSKLVCTVLIVSRFIYSCIIYLLP